MSGLPPDELQAGLADRYDLHDVVGRGGMATVYRGYDRRHRRQVAVKVLRPDLAANIGSERFLKEIQIAAQLGGHPHIVALYDSGEVSGMLYYVMPFIEGESLRQVLSRLGLMDLAGALEITRRVADALDYAHRKGVLHRDVKPENILLPDGHAVVADFGIAKALSTAAGAERTRTGVALGTPGYMSPEQAAGLTELDARTDVYSLGVVAYEMLIGGLPGLWVSEEAVRAGRLVDATPEHRARLDRLPRGMERALVRALAVRREDRFPTPGELAGALEHPEDLTVGRSVAPAPEPVPAKRSSAGAPAPAGSARPQPRATNDFFGAPMAAIAERVVEGEVAEEDLPPLAEEARLTYGIEGYVTTQNATMMWTPRRPKKRGNILDVESMFGWEPEAPQVFVRVVSRAGQTRIRVEERLDGLAAGVYGGIFAGAGGGIGLTLFFIGVFALNWAPIIGLAAGASAIFGSYPLSRAIYRSAASGRIARIEDLADRIAEQCEEVAR